MSDDLHLPTSPGGVRIDRVAGGTNAWVVGDDEICLVVDAPEDVEGVLRAVGDRELLAILCTHGDPDHVAGVGDLYDETGALEYLHPGDRELWDLTYEEPPPAHDLADGDVVELGDVELHVSHTPGHSPGGCCFHVPALGVLLSGDTVTGGGPSAGEAGADGAPLPAPVLEWVLRLPADTVVLPAHGEPTTVGAEAARLSARREAPR